MGNNGESDNDAVENLYSPINLLRIIWPNVKRRQNVRGEN